MRLGLAALISACLYNGTHAMINFFEPLNLSIDVGDEEPVIYNSSQSLGGGMVVYFNFDQDTKILDMALFSETPGWVGLGFNDAHMMYGGKAVIGWVNEEGPYANQYNLDGYAPMLVTVAEENNLGLTLEPSVAIVDGITVMRYVREYPGDEDAIILFARGSDVPESTDSRLVHVYKGTSTLKMFPPTVEEVPAKDENVSIADAVSGKASGIQNLWERIKLEVEAKKLREEQEKSLRVFTLPKGFKIPEADSYYCSAFRADGQQSGWQFDTIEPTQVIHHVIVRRCKTPARDVGEVFECKNTYECAKGGEIIFVWALGAEPMTLPEGFGIGFGEDLGYPFVTIQVHFTNAWPEGLPGDIGVNIQVDEELPAKWANVSIMHQSDFKLNPNKFNTDVVADCVLRSPAEIHVFRARSHAHSYGTYITGYLNGEEFFGRSPQDPQIFADLDKEVTIRPGDRITAVCSFNTLGEADTISVGANGKDEMCNLYLMFYSDVHVGWDCSNKDAYSGWHQKEGSWVSDYAASEITELPFNAPADAMIGIRQVTGIDVNTPTTDGTTDPENSIINIFHRSDRLWTSDQWDHVTFVKGAIEGDVIERWEEEKADVHSFGANAHFMSHGLTVDDEDGSIWVTDVGAHQVFHYSKEGDLIKTLGERLVPGSEDHQFCMPTDTTITTDNTVVVSDGYCNKRVVEYNKTTGEFIRTIELDNFGHTNVLAHSITYDRNKQKAYVADRENGFILSVPLKGTQKSTVSVEVDLKGRKPYAVFYSPQAGGILAVLVQEGKDSYVEVYQQSTDPTTPFWNLVGTSPVCEECFLHDLSVEVFLNEQKSGATVHYYVSGWTRTAVKEPIIRKYLNTFTFNGHKLFPTNKERLFANASDMFTADDVEENNAIDELVVLVGKYNEENEGLDFEEESSLKYYNYADKKCPRENKEEGTDFKDMNSEEKPIWTMLECDEACVEQECALAEFRVDKCTLWFGWACKTCNDLVAEAGTAIRVFANHPYNSEDCPYFK